MEIHKSKNRKISKTGLFVFFVLIVFGIITAIAVYANTNTLTELKKTESELLNSIEDEKKESENIEKSQEYYESDEYIEKVAREQLGYVKPNEVVYILK